MHEIISSVDVLSFYYFFLKKEEKVITITFNNTEKEEYNKLEAAVKQIYLDMKTRDPSLISKNVLKLTSAWIPLRVACNGGQVEEAESKI